MKHNSTLPLSAEQIAARNQLIHSCLTRVEAFVRKLSYDYLSENDMLDIAYFMIIRVAQDYDASKGISFYNFALPWIIKEIKAENEKRQAYYAGHLSFSQLEISVEDQDGEDKICFEDQVSNVDRVFDTDYSISVREQQAFLDKILGLLPERERLVIELAYGLTGEEPMTDSEIASRLSVSRAMVYKLKQHALKRMSA